MIQSFFDQELEAILPCAQVYIMPSVARRIPKVNWRVNPDDLSQGTTPVAYKAPNKQETQQRLIQAYGHGRR
jgi:hypothetical protein